MAKSSLGIIETIGLVAAVVTADTCVKSANVNLIGYELTKGGGMAVIKIEGDVGAVKAAVQAVKSVLRKDDIWSTKVIPRPSEGIDKMTKNSETVGYKKPEDKEEKQIKELQEEQEVKTVEFFEESNKKKSKFQDEKPKNISEIIEEPEDIEEILEEPEDIEEILEEPEDIEEILEEPEHSEEILEKKEVEKEEKEEKEEEENIEVTCNLCGDSKCPRKKGDLRKTCIHYDEL